MQGSHQFVRFGGKDGAGFDRLTFCIVPFLPQAREREAVVKLLAEVTDKK